MLGWLPLKDRYARLMTIFTLLLLVLASAGIASAAVSGSFSSTYDGWNDGSSNEVEGHEIQISGTIEVTGNSAINPNIVIKGSESTVIDQESVQVFVEGDRSIDFDRLVEESRVVYQTDEIPSGTTLRVQYNTYYTGGADSGDVQVGNVEILYDTPGGEQQQESFSVQNSLDNRPENVIDRLNQNINQSQTMGTIQEILSYIGGLAVVFIVLWSVWKLYDYLWGGGIDV